MLKTIENVVDFADLCVFAEQEKIAYYNQAHDILFKEAYPWPESQVREVYLSEMKYLNNEMAKEILTKFMEKNSIKFITVTK